MPVGRRKHPEPLGGRSKHTVAIPNDDKIRIARSACTEKQFAAWILTDIQGASLRAAADLLDISLGTTRERIKVVRQRIFEHVGAEFPAVDDEVLAAPERTRDVGTRAMVRGLLQERDGDYCYLCHRRTGGDLLQVDHIVPQSKGGTDDPWNLALACGRCNGQKGACAVSLLISSGRPVYHPT